MLLQLAADGNGFFHPLGDHAQASFLIDNQPISDQQSKLFSTQLPTSAVQSMEVTTSTKGAEFGDKTSLVAQITTRSGLNAGQPFGSITSRYGSFGTAGGDVSLGLGNARFGNFIALDGVRTFASEDRIPAERLHFALVGAGFQTFFDHESLPPGGISIPASSPLPNAQTCSSS